MNEPQGTLARALRFITNALTPLEQDLSTPGGVVALLQTLGVNTPVVPPSLLAVAPVISALGSKLAAFETAAATDETSAAAVAALADLASAATAAFGAISALPSQLQADLAAYPGLLAAVDFGALARRLADYLLIQNVRRNFPAIYNLLLTVGVFQADPVDDNGSYIPPYIQYAIRGDRLRQLAKNPGAVAADVYGWGADFDPAPLLERLEYLLFSVGLASGQYAPDDDGGSAVPGLAIIPSGNELYVPLFSDATDQAAVLLALGIGAITPASGTGVMIRPVAFGALSETMDLGNGLTLTLTADGDLTAPVALTIEDPGGLALQTGSGSLMTTVSATLTWQPQDGSRPQVLHVPDWVTIDIAGIEAGLTVTDSNGTVSLGLEAGLVDAALTVTPAAADALVRQTFPPNGVTTHFPFAVTWSPGAGIAFKGTSGLALTIPVHASIAGVLTINTLDVRLDTAPGSGLTLTAAISAGATIGPVQAVVDKVGVAIPITFPPGGGNLGRVNAAILFKPPDGIGLAIDAGVVTGGGFVLCDPAKQQYAGLLQFRLLDQLSATVIALLDAAGPGWSLLGLVFVDGFVPIQLGFGFTLNAVGGMVGLNRSAAVDALRAGLRSGGLDTVMFPANPVAQASKVIGQLEQDFPVTVGRYLFGPMAEIGWGDPTLVRIKLGLLIELPAPIRLVLLAQMSAVLPDEQAKLVVLHVDAVGEIDFGQGTAALDAVLHDSRIAAFTVSGQLALRAGWGAQRELVLSVGGLHPQFQPPPGFPVLPRVIIAMASGDNPRLRLEAYLAVTSNTVQVGAKLELHAAAGGFALDGHLGFDALFHLDPFSFQAEMAGGLALTYQGTSIMTVGLDLLLSGPAPWHAKGTASFTVLLLNVTVSFDVSWGQPPDLSAPVTAPDPTAQLLAALGAASSWSAQAPAGLNSMVGLRPATGSGPVAHPLGTLAVHQRMVPLGLELQRFGGAELSQPVTLGIDAGSVKVGGQPAAGLTPVQDYFAPAQYRDLTDDQKLSSPSYEPYQSGISLRLAGFATAGWQSTPIGYATLVADPDAPAPAPVAVTPQAPVAPVAAVAPAASTATALAASTTTPPSIYSPPGASLPAQVATGSAAQAPTLGQSRYQGQPRPYATVPTLYLVVGTTDLAPHTDGGLPSQPVSYTRASDALAAYLATHPGAQGQLQVASARLAATGDQPPASTLTITGPQYQAQAAQPWISPATTLAINALAGSPVASLSYRWYQQGTTPPAWTVVTGRQATVSPAGPDGFYQLDWHATGTAGNTEPTRSQVLRLDGTAPASALTGTPLQQIAGALYATGATQLTLTATDAGSGVATLSYRCYPAGTTPPPFTQGGATQARFALSGPDGTYQIDWHATDQVGNTQAQQSQQVTLDTQAPVSILTAGSPQYPPGTPQYVTSQTQLAITATDAGSGVATLSYRCYPVLTNPVLTNPAGTTPPAFTTITTGSARFTLSGADGPYQLDWYSVDALGNTEATNHQVLNLDDTPPTSALTIGSPDYPTAASQYVTSASQLALTATDAGSGVRSISYRYYPAGQSPVAWTVAAGARVPFTLYGADGLYQLDWYATDQVGNAQAQQTQRLALDNTPPATTLAITGPQYPPATPQYVTSASACTLTATDAGSGVGTLSYRWYAQGVQAPPLIQAKTAQVSFTLSGPDGLYQVDWQSVDRLGNLEALHSQQIHLDDTPPVITITQPAAIVYPHNATLSLAYIVTDGPGSGVASVTPTLDNQASLAGHGLANMQPIVLLTELPLGTHVFAITARDNLGNTSSTSVAFTIIATADSIKQDVTYFLGTKDITSAGVATALTSQLNAAAAARAIGQCATAAKNYQAFINSLLSAQAGKFVSARAAAIMTADAQYLISHCP